ncbi:transmembrane protein 69 isoform X4 [Felis catus]|uniref:transmembrane protein 69 isoform X4 n=1 Tax=Felis catus TaxID=9685 RepID=UPI001D19B909|nr:transmembrane protein 69 isoform X4 [Felis catus]
MESLAWEPVQRWSSSHPDCSPTRPFSGSAEGLLPPTCRKLPFPEYLAILAAQLYLHLLIPRWQHTSDSAPPLSCKNELIRTAWHLPEQDFQLDPACFISSRSFLRHLQRYSFHGIRC